MAEETGKTTPEKTQETTLSSTDFMREQIKQRPLNRKKLLQRTLLTVSLAVVFGVVALLTFVLLEPLVSRLLYPEPEPEVNHVTLVDAPAEEEVSPEDLIADENEMNRQEPAEDAVPEPYSAQGYAMYYTSLRTTASEASRSLVLITGVKSGTAWSGTAFEESGLVTGLVIADNGQSLLILCALESVADAEELTARFFDGSEAKALLLTADEVSGLCVLQVAHASLSADALERIPVAVLASSSLSILVGQPVIALGAPAGVPDSVAYGCVTSASRIAYMADANFSLLSTDIGCNAYSDGVLFNLRGEVLGIFTPALTGLLTQDPAYASLDTGQLTALSISSLRHLVESMSNASLRPYLGVFGEEVPASVRQREELPQGAYITRIAINSPAMTSGIQSGDIITAVNGADILSYTALSNILIDLSAGDTADITLMRKGPEGYTELTVPVTLGEP
ncbi:MAG: serine protease [Lachnospiraceae bacterium]|nr:serine protease [Lachnospiraceae bacterium]